jgi:hypothetical protein
MHIWTSRPKAWLQLGLWRARQRRRLARLRLLRSLPRERPVAESRRGVPALWRAAWVANGAGNPYVRPNGPGESSPGLRPKADALGPGAPPPGGLQGRERLKARQRKLSRPCRPPFGRAWQPRASASGLSPGLCSPGPLGRTGCPARGRLRSNVRHRKEPRESHRL